MKSKTNRNNRRIIFQQITSCDHCPFSHLSKEPASRVWFCMWHDVSERKDNMLIEDWNEKEGYYEKDHLEDSTMPDWCPLPKADTLFGYASEDFGRDAYLAKRKKREELEGKEEE